LRYAENVTGLLEKALRRIQALSNEEQDAIAAQILESLDDEEAWERSFRKDPEKMRVLAQEARDEHLRKETRPLDELLGE
jgi:ribosomal protein L31E